MIKVENYKMFRGVMRIVPVSGLLQPFEVEGSWLYRPDCDCWFDGRSSYPARICVVVEDKGD